MTTVPPLAALQMNSAEGEGAVGSKHSSPQIRVCGDWQACTQAPLSANQPAGQQMPVECVSCTQLWVIGQPTVSVHWSELEPLLQSPHCGQVKPEPSHDQPHTFGRKPPDAAPQSVTQPPAPAPVSELAPVSLN
jgi:hypothetical protein